MLKSFFCQRSWGCVVSAVFIGWNFPINSGISLSVPHLWWDISRLDRFTIQYLSCLVTLTHIYVYYNDLSVYSLQLPTPLDARQTYKHGQTQTQTYTTRILSYDLKKKPCDLFFFILLLLAEASRYFTNKWKTFILLFFFFLALREAFPHSCLLSYALFPSRSFQISLYQPLSLFIQPSSLFILLKLAGPFLDTLLAI